MALLLRQHRKHCPGFYYIVDPQNWIPGGKILKIKQVRPRRRFNIRWWKCCGRRPHFPVEESLTSAAVGTVKLLRWCLQWRLPFVGPALVLITYDRLRSLFILRDSWGNSKNLITKTRTTIRTRTTFIKRGDHFWVQISLLTFDSKYQNVSLHARVQVPYDHTRRAPGGTASNIKAACACVRHSNNAVCAWNNNGFTGGV